MKIFCTGLARYGIFLMLILETQRASAQTPPPLRSGGPYAVTSESLDPAGGNVAWPTGAPTYRVRESLGVLTTLPAASVLYAYNSGVVGQSPNAIGFLAQSSAPALDEGGSVGLRGWLLWSDATRSAPDPAEVAWSVVSGPLTIGNASAWAAPVWADASAVVRGRIEGQTGTVSLLVRDTQADNFGAYANDGLPDSWQVHWFGQDNPQAAPDADPSGSGQTNRFSYLAGLNPLDPRDRFAVQVSAPAEPNGSATVAFGPVQPGRVYTVESCDDPVLGTWRAVAPAATAGPGETQHVVADAMPSATKRIYRVRIELAP